MKTIILSIASLTVFTLSTLAQNNNWNYYPQQNFNSQFTMGLLGGNNSNNYTTVTTTTTTYSATSTTTTYGGDNINYNQGNYNNTGFQNTSQCTFPLFNEHPTNCNNNCSDYTNYNNSMNDEEFEYALNSLQLQGFDDTRLSLAKQILINNRVRSSQIKQLMEAMSFESTRLALAKFSWKHCIDKRNFYKVYEAFWFESSTREMIQYTSNH